VKTAALLLAAFAAASAEPPIGPAQARSSDTANGILCGHDARDNEKLLADLRAKPGVTPLQDDSEFVQLMDSQRDIVWAFTVRGGSAYPAISCNELGPYQGRLVFRQSVICNGASETDCKSFYVINRLRNAEMAAEIEASIGARQ
jgi:hypothetical protein